MSKIEIKATELTDTDVNFVSMVKHGANRIPFRITKKENEMSLDLQALGRKFFKKAEPTPTIVAVLMEKSADVAVTKALLLEAGIPVEAFTLTAEDEVTTLTKSDTAPSADAVVLRLSKGVGLVINNLKKSFTGFDFESTDFTEVHATGSFCASLATAADMLQMTIGNILYDTEDPAEAASLLGAAVDGFKAYATALTAALPVQAFKADILLSKAAKKKPMPTEDKMDGGKDDAKENADGSLKKAADAGSGVGKAPAKGANNNAAATADDKQNTEVNAKPGAKTIETKKGANIPEMTGESAAGEGAAEQTTQGSDAAKAKADADLKKFKQNAGPGESAISGGTEGLPAKLMVKNEGDADAGKKGKGKKMPDGETGAGEQQAPAVETVKADDAVMQAIQALAKSVQDSFATQKTEMQALTERVEGVAALARKTDTALNGTVFNETSEDAARLKKSEQTTMLPLIDTAYSRRA